MAGRGSADWIGNTASSAFMAGDACDAVQLELELMTLSGNHGHSALLALEPRADTQMSPLASMVL